MSELLSVNPQDINAIPWCRGLLVEQISDAPPQSPSMPAAGTDLPATQPSVRSFHLSVDNLVVLATLLGNVDASRALKRLPTSFSAQIGHLISPPLHKFYAPHEMRSLLDLVSTATEERNLGILMSVTGGLETGGPKLNLRGVEAGTRPMVVQGASIRFNEANEANEASRPWSGGTRPASSLDANAVGGSASGLLPKRPSTAPKKRSQGFRGEHRDLCLLYGGA